MKPKVKVTSVEIFLDELSKKGLPIELIGEYKGSGKKTNFRCKTCGNEWEAQPYAVLHYQSLGCIKCRDKDQGKRKRKTHDQYTKELSLVNPNIEVIESYQTARTKILHRCKLCGHEWSVVPYSLLHGTGCPICGIAKQVEKRTKSSNSFFDELAQINPHIEILTPYQRASVKVKCKCLKCEYIWETHPSMLLSGRGCAKCANNIRKTHNDFLSSLPIHIQNNIEILGTYISAKTPIRCKCKICSNEFESIPERLLIGNGCKKCADKSRGIAFRKTHDQFVEELKQVNSDIEIIGKYITSKDPIECRCKKCGNIWTPCASSLLSGFGCPHCLMPHGERDIEKYLQDKNIPYISQKKFPDLYGTKKKLSYDFYLPDYNLLIEFQGEQHERPIDLFGGEQTFVIQKERDEKKRKYASDHNIDLLEIWYYDQKNISTILNNYLQSKSVETVISPVAI